MYTTKKYKIYHLTVLPYLKPLGITSFLIHSDISQVQL